MVKKYETMLVFSLTEGEEKVAELTQKFTSLIEANGEIEAVNEWGKRRLAYEINHQNEGYYVLIDFSAKEEFPAELDRVVNITDGVLRSLIVSR